MRTTINVQDNVINYLLIHYQSKTKTEAVNKGLTELVKHLKLQELIGLRGKVEIDDFTEELKKQEILKLQELNKYE